jgi:hypothetical protein
MSKNAPQTISIQKKIPPPIKAKPSNLDIAQIATNNCIKNYVATAHAIKNSSNFKNSILALERNIRDEFTNLKQSLNRTETLTHLFDTLDTVIDARNGIDHILVKTDNGIAHIGSNEKSSVVIRDARLQADRLNDPSLKGVIVPKPEDTPEASLAIAVAAVRGINIITQMDKSMSESDKHAIQDRIIDVLQPFSKTIYMTNTQEHRNKAMHEFNTAIGNILKQSKLTIAGKPLSKLKDDELSDVMVYARDFANFEAKNHPTIATISSNISTDPQKPLYAVSASIPITPVGSELKELYKDLDNQGWFKDLPPIKQEFIRRYKDQIQDGKHTIPTQLRELVGLKNAYLETTSVITKNGSLGATTKQLRSATPAYNLGYGKYTEDITDKQVHHMHKLSGKQTPNVVILNYDLGTTATNLSNDVKTEHNIKKSVKSSAKRDGLPVANHVVNINFSKDENFGKISDKFIRISTTARQIQWNSCKSGKDRTGAVTANNSIAWIQHKYGNKVSKVDQKIIEAGHQEALAGSNGATIGVRGLKFGSIAMGLGNKHNNIIAHKHQIDNTISTLNHVHFSQTLRKSKIIPNPPVLQQAPTQPQKQLKQKDTFFTKVIGNLAEFVNALKPSNKKDARVNPEKFSTTINKSTIKASKNVIQELAVKQKALQKAKGYEKFAVKPPKQQHQTLEEITKSVQAPAQLKPIPKPRKNINKTIDEAPLKR